MSFLIQLFGCASDEAAKGTNAGKEVSIRPASAYSPEDEASELRGLDALCAKMKARGASEAATAAFAKNYEAMVGGDTGIIGEDEIEAVQELPSLQTIKYVLP